MTERLLTVRDVAELVGLSTESVLRRWRAGEIPGFRLSSNVLRFDPSEIEHWLEDLQATRKAEGMTQPTGRCERIDHEAEGAPRMRPSGTRLHSPSAPRALRGALPSLSCVGPAVAWEYLPRNPAKGTGRNPAPPVIERTVLEPGDVDRLAGEMRSPFDVAVIVSAWCYLRPLSFSRSSVTTLATDCSTFEAPRPHVHVAPSPCP